MSASEIEALITTVRDRPLPKDSLSFFQYKQDIRVFLTVTDQTSVWRDDLIIGERLFGETVVCTTATAETEFDAAVAETRDVLKQRMKYPNVKENPQLEQIAKTWILPTKLHKGPSVTQLLQPQAESMKSALAPFFTEIKAEQPVLHYVKIALESGATRQLIYKLLDDGFRPSLLCVKWDHDMDDHIPTAHCVGHLLNVGYSQIYQNDATGYALYTFTDQTLYDICSVKGVSMTNPFMNSLLQSVTISSVGAAATGDAATADAAPVAAAAASTTEAVVDAATGTPTATDKSD
jgi:hypothetical protein